jgi:hypothetical protein
MITISPRAQARNLTPHGLSRRLSGRVGIAVAITLLCVFVLPDGIARAQEAGPRNVAPARIDNIWGGFDHEPIESQVQSAERARGVAPSASQQRVETRIVEQLYRETLKNAASGSTGTAAG